MCWKFRSVEPFRETSVLTLAILDVAKGAGGGRDETRGEVTGPVEGAFPLRLGAAPGRSSKLDRTRAGRIQQV